MKTSKKIILGACIVVILSNLPPISAIVDFLIKDSEYCFSGADDPSYTLCESIQTKYNYQTATSLEYRKMNPTYDTLIYRNFSKNPLYFWRWGDYLFAKKYRLPYISREQVIKNWKEKHKEDKDRK